MPAQKQRILANNVQELVASIRAEDIATLMALLAGDVMLRQRILRKIVQTVEEQANVRVSNFEMWSFIFLRQNFLAANHNFALRHCVMILFLIKHWIKSYFYAEKGWCCFMIHPNFIVTLRPFDLGKIAIYI